MLDAYARKQDELYHRELLDLVRAVQLGMGSMEKDDARRTISDWNRRAKARHVAASVADISALGIEVVKRGQATVR